MAAASFGADRPGEIGVGGLPVFDAFNCELRIKKNAAAEFGDGFIARASEQFGDPVEIDVSGLMKGDGEASAALSIMGVTGGCRTRSEKTGPCLAFPVSRS